MSYRVILGPGVEILESEGLEDCVSITVDDENGCTDDLVLGHNRRNSVANVLRAGSGIGVRPGGSAAFPTASEGNKETIRKAEARYSIPVPSERVHERVRRIRTLT